MDFLALNDDVKFIISKHLQSNLKIRTMLSKYHDLQKILFGEIVFDDDFCKILKLQNDVEENDDFKNAKIFKRYEDDKFYMMIRNSYINCTIKLIENYPFNNAEELKKKMKYVCMYECMYTYVCMYVCMYVRTYVHVAS